MLAEGRNRESIDALRLLIEKNSNHINGHVTLAVALMQRQENLDKNNPGTVEALALLDTATVHCKLYNLGHQSVVPPGDGTGWTLRGQVRVRTTSEACFPPGICKDLQEQFKGSSKRCPTLLKSSAAVAYPLNPNDPIPLIEKQM